VEAYYTETEYKFNYYIKAFVLAVGAHIIMVLFLGSV